MLHEWWENYENNDWRENIKFKRNGWKSRNCVSQTRKENNDFEFHVIGAQSMDPTHNITIETTFPANSYYEEVGATEEVGTVELDGATKSGRSSDAFKA